LLLQLLLVFSIDFELVSYTHSDSVSDITITMVLPSAMSMS